MSDIPPLALPLPSDLTHHEALLCMWIGSDLPLLDSLRWVAQGNEFVADDVQLATTVADMLGDLTGVLDHGGNLRKARTLLASVPLPAVEAVDLEGWARIRAALLAGTEN